jgi:hypothetical protein
MNRTALFRNGCLAAVLALVLAAPSPASAYWPYIGYGGFGGYGWGFNQATNYVPSPPYYAIYPPVYYSHQLTARPYGASPYAWYAGMSPVTDVAMPEWTTPAEPVMIENPFVKGSRAATKAPAGAKAEMPLKMQNPFVASTSR